MHEGRERRRWRRESVSWPVEMLGHDGQFRLGEMYDVTAHGAFIKPHVDASASEFVQGDRLLIRCCTQRGAISVVAVVCWDGWSEDHECSGLGVRLDQPEPRLDLLAWGENQE